MRLSYCCAVVLVFAGCAAHSSLLPADNPMSTLTIRWQRLVDASDKTCPRCASTEQEVRKATAHLKQSLAPAGIAVKAEAERLDEKTFFAAPLESNRIWINGKSLEDWLGATTASSACCGSCAGAECRTVSVGGQTYEAIPAGLIVRAGLIAAGDALRQGAPAETTPWQFPSGGTE